MTDMRAVGFTEFGDPSVLGIVTVPKPAAGPGQVLVKVAAATVNPTDLGFRHGGRPLPGGVTPPFIAGMDLAGVIESVGPQVSRWRPGDRVMAAVSPWEPGGGAQAEYRVVDSDQLAAVPDGWSLTEAATLPMNGLTVATALDMLALPAGSTLAVTGCTGIVGQYAIQLGTHRGLTVIGDAAAADEALVASFGPRHVCGRGEAMAAAVRSLYRPGWTRFSTRRCSGHRSCPRSATAASCSRSGRSRARRNGTSRFTWCSSASTCTRETGSRSWRAWSTPAC
jgi:NADPH:quinone reductase-like Zn-dependent oxidoreductase